MLQPTTTSIEIQEILTTLPQQVVDWGARVIGADKAWAKRYTGKGLIYGQIDTGIDFNHPDLAPNMLQARSFIDNTNGSDANFHGTHVAGIAAGCNNNVGIVGVASDAKILSAKIFDVNNNMTSTAEFAALEWLANNGADVINMSYGGFIPMELAGAKEFEAKYRKIMDELEASGIVLVAAAGNSGKNGPTWDTVVWPARFDSVIAVAAVSSNLNRADFSSSGEDIDFTMPGVDIHSCYPNNRWIRANGTSMAAPMLSGCVLVLQQWAMETLGRKLRPAEVRQYLKSFSVDLGIDGFDVEHGFGKVNIGKIGAQLQNERIVRLDVAPQIINGRTMIPFRAVAEAMNATVDFNPTTRTITTTTADNRTIILRINDHNMIVRN